MSLNDEIKQIVIRDLENIIVPFVDSYKNLNGKKIKFFYDEGIITKKSAEFALENAIFNQARRDYNLMISKNLAYEVYADHIGSPSCLAYSFEKNQFSKKEIKKIPFDHGENVNLYKNRYGKGNLPEILFKEIISS